MAQEPNAEANYGEVFTCVLVLTSFVALGLSGLARELLQMMTAPQYWRAYSIVPIIAWSYVCFALSSVVNVGLFVHHKTATVSWLVLVALLANILGNLLLIPVYGAHGAALATFASYLLLFVLNLAFSWRFIAIAFEWRKLALLSGLVLAAGACMAVVPEANLCFDIAVKLLVLSCFLIVLLALGFFRRLGLPQRALSLWTSVRAAL
jgi:O-antigen/teichoic acid export membrane protein